MRVTQANAGRIAAVIYTGAALGAALAVFLAATLGGYDWVARLGGAVWVFLLAMIVLMPTVTPFVRDRAHSERPSQPVPHH